MAENEVIFIKHSAIAATMWWESVAFVFFALNVIKNWWLHMKNCIQFKWREWRKIAYITHNVNGKLENWIHSCDVILLQCKLQAEECEIYEQTPKKN